MALIPTEQIKRITTTVKIAPYVLSLTNRDKSFIVPKAISKIKIISTVHEYENSLKFSSKLAISVLPDPVKKNLKARSTGNSI